MLPVASEVLWRGDSSYGSDSVLPRLQRYSGLVTLAAPGKGLPLILLTCSLFFIPPPCWLGEAPHACVCALTSSG